MNNANVPYRYSSVPVYDHYVDSHDPSRYIANITPEFAKILNANGMAGWIFEPTIGFPGAMIVHDPIVLLIGAE